MEFKKGDRVQIKSWEEMEEEFGLDSNMNINCRGHFTTYMKHLCSRCATITKIDNPIVLLENWNYDSGDLEWTFSTDMIKKVDSANAMIYAYDNINEILKENGGDNMENKVLNLWCKRQIEKINNKYDELGKRYKESIEIVNKYHDMIEEFEKNFKELYKSIENFDNDYIIETCDGNMYQYIINEDKINKDIEKKYDENKRKELLDLDNEVKEIEAQLSLSDDLEYQLEVLTRYGIIDKKTKKIID